MEAVILFISMLLVHWIADFLCQTHEMSINKSSSNLWLIKHTGMYTAVWFLVLLGYMIVSSSVYGTEYHILQICMFLLITFTSHTATDYITSREVKKYFDKDDYHNGFVVIGFDQILHYVQLILTFYFIYYEN